MRDSDTYLAIIDEGREAQVKDDIRRLGTRRLGEPIPAIVTRLQGITDLDRLMRIHDNLLESPTWDALLDTP